MKLKRTSPAARSRACTSKSSPREGAAVVEFALIIPLLLIMIFGMVEVSRMLMVLHATTGAAREAIRAAVVTGVEEEQVRQVATGFYGQQLLQC